MPEYRLAEAETRFAELVWQNEPIPSGALVRLCAERLGWKKSTTYTVLSRLCERGLFQNKDGVVTSLVSRDELDAARSEEFVAHTFGGSLPRFFAAFTGRRKLTPEEAAEIRRMIDEAETR